ncbi:hypothetical protein RND71_009073 [Anisodus tanguticus]|uniref:SANTA domain-containing protein n=1 Tax=Anisodus tanguticus TaxID=243964 RepID=A0AAE1VUA3_9SOLA|nr:hypothetical protein RND71_009073 [Anisodus tanguticus]
MEEETFPNEYELHVASALLILSTTLPPSPKYNKIRKFLRIRVTEIVAIMRMKIISDISQIDDMSYTHSASPKMKSISEISQIDELSYTHSTSPKMKSIPEISQIAALSYTTPVSDSKTKSTDSSTVTSDDDDDASFTEAKSHARRMKMIRMIRVINKLKAVRRRRSKSLCISNCLKINSGKPKTATSLTTSCTSVSSCVSIDYSALDVISSREAANRGVLKERVDCVPRKMKVFCSPHMWRRAEAILKVLSSHGCASEVRIRQLLDKLIRRQDERVFHSAAIAKRHDTVTFVTVDGITILVSGFINRCRTLQNGFSAEVCNQFLLGFPYNWEESAALSFGESTNEDAAFGISDFSESVDGSADRASSSFSMSIDHLPANVLRDLLLSSDPEGRKLRKSIFSEIRQKYGTNVFNVGEASCLNQKSGNQVTTQSPSSNENPSQKKKAKTSRKQEDSCIPDAKSGKEDFQEATPKGMTGKSVLGRILHKSGGYASFDGESSCLSQKSGDQVTSRGPSLDETAHPKKKTAANLRKEDDNHVLQKCNDERGAVIDKNSISSSPSLTRGKASVYKKTKVDQKQEEKKKVHKVESGQGDIGVVNHAISSSNGPLTRSRAQKQGIMGVFLCRLATHGY